MSKLPLLLSELPVVKLVQPDKLQLSALATLLMPLAVRPAPLPSDKVPPIPAFPTPALKDADSVDSIEISPPSKLIELEQPLDTRIATLAALEPDGPPLMRVLPLVPVCASPEDSAIDPEEIPSTEANTKFPLCFSELPPDTKEISPPSLSAPDPAIKQTSPPL
jgi:hypothetical protein